jgi:hypothetical protein
MGRHPDRKIAYSHPQPRPWSSGVGIKKGSGDKKEISKAWVKFKPPNSKYDPTAGWNFSHPLIRVLGA